MPEDNPDFAAWAQKPAASADGYGIESSSSSGSRAGRSRRQDVAIFLLDHYVCSGQMIVPVAGVEDDGPASATISAGVSTAAIVPVPGTRVLAYGGPPHFVAQQVRARDAGCARPYEAGIGLRDLRDEPAPR